LPINALTTTKRDRTQKHPPMYRDPATGATWSGKGNIPGWIREAPDREVFKIANPDE
jgi:DNA-binding protein H-NS